MNKKPKLLISECLFGVPCRYDGKDNYIEDIYIMDNRMEFTMEYKGKKIDFAKMKMAHRDTKGIKVRV